jgi:hypothetical protein
MESGGEELAQVMPESLNNMTTDDGLANARSI